MREVAAAALVHPALVKGRLLSTDAMQTHACQVRITGAPQALAALNGGVLALMDWLHVPNVASQMRHFCAYPAEALQLLCGTLLR